MLSVHADFTALSLKEIRSAVDGTKKVKRELSLQNNFTMAIYTHKQLLRSLISFEGGDSALCKNLLIVPETRRSLQILFTLVDGLVIETVIIPCDRGRNTVCVSSQVGCAMNCQFCFTGRQAFIMLSSLDDFSSIFLSTYFSLFYIVGWD